MAAAKPLVEAGAEVDTVRPDVRDPKAVDEVAR